MTTLLTEKNLTKMKKTQELNLPETAYIQSLTVSNSAGGWSEAWQTRLTKPARIGDPKGEMEKSIASTVTGGKVYTITLPADVVVNDEERIQINGIDYQVLWSNTNKSNKTATRVVVSEVK